MGAALCTHVYAHTCCCTHAPAPRTCARVSCSLCPALQNPPKSPGAPKSPTRLEPMGGGRAPDRGLSQGIHPPLPGRGGAGTTPVPGGGGGHGAVTDTGGGPPGTRAAHGGGAAEHPRRWREPGRRGRAAPAVGTAPPWERGTRAGPGGLERRGGAGSHRAAARRRRPGAARGGGSPWGAGSGPGPSARPSSVPLPLALLVPIPIPAPPGRGPAPRAPRPPTSPQDPSAAGPEHPLAGGPGPAGHRHRHRGGGGAARRERAAVGQGQVKEVAPAGGVRAWG